jgi:hypothetical protein
MERRTAMKGLISGFGLMALPAWANGWNFEKNLSLKTEPPKILKYIVDTLIPGGEIPGALDLRVDQFVALMLKDCYDEETNGKINKLYGELENEKFGDLESIKKLEKLDLILKSENKNGPLSLIKNLTITGYSTSEYVQTQHLNYVMAPGHFAGCVNL